MTATALPHHPAPPLWPTDRIDLDASAPVPTGDNAARSARPIAPASRWLGHEFDEHSWIDPADPEPVARAHLADCSLPFDELILPESSLAESSLGVTARTNAAQSERRFDPSSSCS